MQVSLEEASAACAPDVTSRSSLLQQACTSSHNINEVIIYIKTVRVVNICASKTYSHKKNVSGII